MIAVIFELMPADGRAQEYLDTAAVLRPVLDHVDGFISIERFQSLSTPGKILSLSFWRDEDAVALWRKTEAHRMAQAAGRGGVFRDYRLRVASVLRDYGMADRAQAPIDSVRFHG
jgi:heme-degrading monooxygenase HmoA